MNRPLKQTPERGSRSGWRLAWRPPKGFLIFWACFLAAAAAGAAYLQYLGPPPKLVAATPVVPVAIKPTPALAAAQPRVPVLLPGAPEIAIMLAGLGYDPAQSLQAASALPAPVSFAVSPFGSYLNETEAYARANDHELILMLPMQALLARAPAGQNQALLDWSFKRLQHFTGVTDAIGPAMGGGFMQDEDARNWLLGNIVSHGLYYIEGDVTASGFGAVSHRVADVVIDPVNHPQDETAELATLVKDARSGHTALGVVLSPTPEAIAKLADWTQSLAGLGIQLVPVNTTPTPPLPSTVSSLP